MPPENLRGERSGITGVAVGEGCFLEEDAVGFCDSFVQPPPFRVDGIDGGPAHFIHRFAHEAPWAVFEALRARVVGLRRRIIIKLRQIVQPLED